jgi:hypothetical protein
MLRIDVSGFSGEGKSEIIGIIRDALKACGKRVLTVEDNRVVANPSPNRVDVVITESQLSKPRATVPDLDFLVGNTESAAYEMAQDNGFVVRIVKRNDIHMPVTYDHLFDRVNLSIVDNTVVAWSVG